MSLINYFIRGSLQKKMNASKFFLSLKAYFKTYFHLRAFIIILILLPFFLLIASVEKDSCKPYFFNERMRISSLVLLESKGFMLRKRINTSQITSLFLTLSLSQSHLFPHKKKPKKAKNSLLGAYIRFEIEGENEIHIWLQFYQMKDIFIVLPIYEVLFCCSMTFLNFLIFLMLSLEMCSRCDPADLLI